MRTTFIAVGGIVLWLGVIRSGWGQGDRLYPLFELTDEDVALIDVADGSVEDWLEAVGEPTLTASDFDCPPSDRGCLPPDPANLDFRLWLGWHRSTSHLYVAMERADDLYFNDFNPRDVGPTLPSMEYHDSGIGFYVDADHSGGQYTGFSGLEKEESRLLGDQQAQWYNAIAETYDESPHVNMGYSNYDYPDWPLHPPYAEGGGRAYGENPTLSVTEFYVTPFDRFIWNSPEESVASELYPGKVIGLWISVADRDGPTLMEGPYITYYISPISSTSCQCMYSDDFVDFLLLGPGGELPEGSVVGSVSWGRIKASLGR